ncbi:MAG: ketosteroid isomerase-like protein [Gammaproteobacteria bacterium]|jgi:ketosteroid isomerase-like protein
MRFENPISAETAFYDAFGRADHTAMMQVWGSSDDIACVHPMGPRLVGRERISESWKMILAGGSQPQFDIRTKFRSNDDNLAVHIVDEIISTPGSSAQFIPVLATNVYQRIDGFWFLILHHASIDSAPREVTSQKRHKFEIN